MGRKRKVFIEITNEDIFRDIQKIKEVVDECLVHARETNGKVKRNTKDIQRGKVVLAGMFIVLVILIVTTTPNILPFLLSLL